MENDLKMLQALNQEVEQSRKILEEMTNEIRNLSDLIQPALSSMITRYRESRNAVLREMRDLVGEMKDIRKFLFEPQHEAEVDRLEKFVSICKEMKELKKDGTLDAICDSILNLAVGKE